MDRQQIGMKLTIDCLGLPFKLDTFEDRLILQKTVYLAQACGVHLGYYFHWYLRGPYSPQLTDDAFAVRPEISAGIEDWKTWKLDARSAARLARLRDLFSDRDRPRLAQRLELLGSVHFLLDRKQVSPSATGITGTLRAYGKRFTHQDVKVALKDLQDYGLLPRRRSRW